MPLKTHVTWTVTMTWPHTENDGCSKANNAFFKCDHNIFNLIYKII